MTPARGEPSPNKGKKFPPEIYTEDEVRAMMRFCSLRAPTGVRNRAIITVIYRGGLRIGEALALKCADVDVNAGTVRILHGKGDKARTIGLDEGSMAVIQRWMDTRKQLGIRANGHPLFCTLDGGPVSDTYVRHMVKRIAAKAGIEKRVHPHGFRHSFSAERAAEGVPINVISAELGHAGGSVATARYIDHLAPPQVIEAGRSRRPFSERGARVQAAKKETPGDETAAELAALRERLAALEAREDAGDHAALARRLAVAEAGKARALAQAREARQEARRARAAAAEQRDTEPPGEA